MHKITSSNDQILDDILASDEDRLVSVSRMQELEKKWKRVASTHTLQDLLLLREEDRKDEESKNKEECNTLQERMFQSPSVAQLRADASHQVQQQRQQEKLQTSVITLGYAFSAQFYVDWCTFKSISVG